MAIYHCSISNVSRGKGASSCATLAYITGKQVHDDRTGNTYSYSRQERVLNVSTIIPPYAPAEYADAEVLFNAIEKYEITDNARTAKKIQVALPKELEMDEQKQILEDYIRHNLTKEGYCATYAIHSGGTTGNVHAHILVTNRSINAKGAWTYKSRKAYALDENGEKIPVIDETTGKQKERIRKGKGVEKIWKRVNVEQNLLDTKEFLKKLRKEWATEVNKHLEPSQYIDHRSNADRGIDGKPTIHEGYAARAIEARGGLADRCKINREIKEYCHIKRKLARVKTELQELQAEEAREQVRQAEQERVKAQKGREASRNKSTDDAAIVKALRAGDLERAITLSRNIGDSDERLMERAVLAFGRENRPLIEIVQTLSYKSNDLGYGRKLYNYARDYREKLTKEIAERKQATMVKENKPDVQNDIAMAIQNNDDKKLTTAYLSHLSKGGSDEEFLTITAKSTAMFLGRKMLGDSLAQAAKVIHHHSSMAGNDLGYAKKLMDTFKVSKKYQEIQNGIVGLTAKAKQDEPDEWCYLSETEKEELKNDTANFER